MVLGNSIFVKVALVMPALVAILLQANLNVNGSAREKAGDRTVQMIHLGEGIKP
jgi:hypothetical protein